MSGCSCHGCHCHGPQEPSGFPWKKIILSVLLLLAAILCPGPQMVKIALFAVAYLVCGAGVLVRSARNLRRGDFFDENALMSLATLGAFLLQEYPEAVCVMLFYQVGEALQDKAAGRSRAGIIQLLSLRPVAARVLRNGREEVCDPQTVQPGETISVRPGERVALDGVITKGSSRADLSALTGESRPVMLNPGDEIWAGSVCLDGVLEIGVRKNYQNSAIAKILQLTEQAAEKKSSTEKFITRFARIYTPVVVAGAVLLAVVPPLWLGDGSLKIWATRALVFLVVSCPCALVLSVPLGFFGGLGGAARHGILIKGSSFLERLARLHTLALDKTGTLTQGTFTILAVEPQPGYTAQTVLALAASAEAHSNHPVARAITRAAAAPVVAPQSVHETAGQGVQAQTPHGTVLAGNGRFMASFGVQVAEPDPQTTCVYVAQNGTLAGRILLGDPLKPDAKHAVEQLKSLLKRLVILSGDGQAAVNHTAKEAGITQAYGNLLPADKVREFEQLLTQTPAGHTTAFVGDGINDAPALARADVSVAMGALGADAAIETADVVLMSDELTRLVTAVRLARFTLHIVRENVWLALGVKAAVLVLGALGYATLWMAVFADVGVSLVAVANALRPLHYRE